jgi:hypothetical protein
MLGAPSDVNAAPAKARTTRGRSRPDAQKLVAQNYGAAAGRLNV